MADGSTRRLTLDLVQRAESGWWEAGDRGARRRSAPVDAIVGHWTGGHPHEGPHAGRKVVAAMRGRKRPDGSPLSVGVHYVIGWDGSIHQTGDLELALVHVGKRAWNDRSIGVECCWPGTAKQAERLGITGDVEPRRVRGRDVDVLTPPRAMLEAWAWLCDALATRYGIPRRVGPPGAAEHWMVPGTTKRDAGGVLVGHLIEAHGWRAA